MNDRARGNVLVACVGDRSYGDDGFGAAVARELDSLDLPDQAAVVNYGIRSLDVAYALLEPWNAVVIVDAMSRGAWPGDLHLFEIEDEAGFESEVPLRATHPYRLVALARSMGEITAPLYVVGCEPDDFGDRFERHVGLSEEVAAAIPEATRMVQWLIRQRLPIEVMAGPRS